MLDERSPSSSPQPPRPAPVPPPHPAYSLAPRPRRPAWFWIAIAAGCLLLLVPLALIVAAIAIPQVFRFRKTANEASAVLVMRTIAQAESTYNITYPANGYACTLAALGGDSSSGSPTAQSAQLIDPTLAASGHKSGYSFTLTCGTKVTLNDQDSYTSYQLTAVPDQINKTGDKGYCSDQDGVLKFDPDGGTNCTQPMP
jgi:type IV pilus assembly protein PilA